MLSKRHIILFFACTFIFNFGKSQKQYQTIEGIITDYQSGDPIPFANISFLNSTRGTTTNEDGYFRFILTKSEEKDTVKVNFLGYQEITISVDKLLHSIQSKNIKLEEKIFELPLVMVGDFDARKLVREALTQIETNYPSKDHILSGFYNEEVNLSDSVYLSYAEGVLDVFKKGYKNKPTISQGIWLDEKLEYSVLKKGFYKTNDEIFLKSKSGSPVIFPELKQGALVAKIIDFLKSDLSFLMKERLNKYDFEVVSMIYRGDKEAYKVKVQYQIDGLGYNGHVIINESDMSILEMQFELGKSATKGAYFRKDVELLSRKFHLVYNKHDGKYTLDLARADNTFLFHTTGDTIRHKMVFTTFDRIYKNLPKYKKNQKLSEYIPTANLFPLEDEYWESANILPRSKRINRLFKAKFSDIKFPSLASKPTIKTQENPDSKKLLFMEFHADWCQPCRIMERTVYNDLEVAQVLQTKYKIDRVNLTRGQGKSYTRRYNVDLIPYNIVLLPSKYVVYRMPGAMNKNEFHNTINILSNKLDVAFLDSLNKAGNTSQIALNIYTQLKEELPKAAAEQLLYLFKSKKLWENPETTNEIFENFVGKGNTKIDAAFLSEFRSFEKFISHEVLDEKIYIMALSKTVENNKKRGYFGRFLKKYRVVDIDRYLLRFDLDYYGMIKSNDKHNKAIIAYYNNISSSSWEETKYDLSDLFLNADSQSDLDQGFEILERFKSNSVEYEWLDVYSLYLYKSGHEEEASKLVQEVKSKALEEGTNYKSVLRDLRNSE